MTSIEIFASEPAIARRSSIMCAGLAVILATALWAEGLRADECVAAAPTKVRGALCGRTIDPSGEMVASVDLKVIDEGDSVVGQTTADSNGDFRFPALRPGKYRLMTATLGWRSFIGSIEISKPDAAKCERPLKVVLSFTPCGGGISKKKPPRLHA
jgi:hypothetical protein